MKKVKFKPNDDLLKLIAATPPAVPTMTTPEKAYFRSLKRRGYSEPQILTFIEKAGYKSKDFFAKKTIKPKVSKT